MKKGLDGIAPKVERAPDAVPSREPTGHCEIIEGTPFLDPIKTYANGKRDGLEAAALYHDGEAEKSRALAKDEPKDAGYFLMEVAQNEQDARAIRAMNEANQ